MGTLLKKPYAPTAESWPKPVPPEDANARYPDDTQLAAVWARKNEPEPLAGTVRATKGDTAPWPASKADKSFLKGKR